jgi:enolase
MQTTITHVRARQVLDSRGNPTVEATVVTSGDGSGTFAVPSGASTGAHEAHERRDEDASRFGGRGVRQAAQAVNHDIAQILIGTDAADQQTLDKSLVALDGTPNKARLGANAILAVSVAAAKAAASTKGVPVWEHLRDLTSMSASRKVPLLYMNLVNGGLHAASRLAFQEYHIVPQTPDAEESLHIGTTVMHGLKKLIRERLGASSANIGDEGGFAPDTDDVRMPLEMLMEVAQANGFADKVQLAMDAAASSFLEDDAYRIGDSTYDAEQMLALYEKMVADFPILSIEDPFGEEAFADFAKLDTSTTVVGDDLTVTNRERLQMAIDAKAISAIIIKPNQVGSLWETLETMRLAREHDIKLVVSHRSGETNDDFIADLAYAFGAFGLKTGAPQRGERVAKYNRLLDIVSHHA